MGWSRSRTASRSRTTSRTRAWSCSTTAGTGRRSRSRPSGPRRCWPFCAATEGGRVSPGRLLFTAGYLLVWPALILFLAADWSWPEGWIFGGWFVAVGASTGAWLSRRHPGLLAERYRMPGTSRQSRRARIIVYGLAVGFHPWIGLVPLDALH